MKLHVLGMPHTETTDAWSACAYTQRTRDFASMMKQWGYEVILYAGEANQADVTEHVPVVSRAEQAQWFPGFDRSKMFNNFESESLPWRNFNARCATEIRKRAQPGDVLCITMGWAQREVVTRLSDLALFPVESGIGYSGVFAPYRVFESVAWRHYMAAKEPNDNLRWFDEVIPRGYYPEQFPLGPGGNDYLFMGRLISRKGSKIAADVCKQLGSKLLVAGQGVKAHKNGEFIQTDEGFTLEGNVHYLGVLTPQERASVMGCVQAVFMPTWYLEPGGGVAIEAQLCGTPVITTPWGAMTETVRQGVTGYHCSSLSEFVHAAEATKQLDRRTIQSQAINRFSSEIIAGRYDTYFKKLSTLNGEGWYAL